MATITVADAVGAITAGTLSTTVPTAGSFLLFGLSGQGVAGITITPALSAGSLAVEGSEDSGAHFTPLVPLSLAGVAVSPLTGATFVQVSVGGMDLVRVRALSGAAFGNGPITVSLQAGEGDTAVTAGGGGGGSVTQGTSPWVVSGTVSTLVPDVAASGALTAAWNGTGSPTAGQAVVVALTGGEASWTAELAGTFSSGTTVNVEGTIDGTTWNPLTIEGGGTTGVTTLANTIAGTGSAQAASGGMRGLTSIRARASVLMGGDSVTTTLRASTAPGGIRIASLPAGIATAAKQPALGVAGTPSADVISVQGESGMTPLAVVATAADGALVTEGAIADAAVSTDANGTINAHIRGIVKLLAAGIPLPTGAATSVLQTSGNTSLSTIATNLPVQGQAAMAASTPVVIANNQSAVPISGTVTANLGTIDGAATAANQATEITSLATIATNVTSTSTTGTETNVANATSSTVLLTSNAARKGATIFNDDTASTGATLKVALGFTATATAFNLIIAPQGYYEVPFRFTGAINGIASAATGTARVVELT